MVMKKWKMEWKSLIKITEIFTCISFLKSSSLKSSSINWLWYSVSNGLSMLILMEILRTLLLFFLKLFIHIFNISLNFHPIAFKFSGYTGIVNNNTSSNTEEMILFLSVTSYSYFKFFMATLFIFIRNFLLKIYKNVFYKSYISNFHLFW